MNEVWERLGCYPEGYFGDFSCDPFIVVMKKTSMSKSSSCERTEVSMRVSSIPRPNKWAKALNRAQIFVQDGGYSLHVPGEGTLRLFGDTFLGCYKPPIPWCNFTDGSLELTSPSVLKITRPKIRQQQNHSTSSEAEAGANWNYRYLQDLQTGRAKPYLPLPANLSQLNFGLWPTSATYDLETNTSIIAHTLIQRTKNFTILESHLALFKGIDIKGIKIAFELPFPVYNLMVQGEHIYFLFGRSEHRFDTFMARFPKSTIFKAASKLTHQSSHEILKDLEYLSGVNNDCIDDCAPGGSCKAHFSNQIRSARAMVKNVLPQSSIAYSKHLGKYVLLHSGFAVGRLRAFFVRTSDTIFGPWGDASLVYERPKYNYGSKSDLSTRTKLAGRLSDNNLIFMFYMGLWQPDLFEEDGRVMVFSYCEHIPAGPLFHELLPNFVKIEFVSKEHNE
eukprot:jgi/Bigna1/131998/aug1.16_g6706